MDFYELISVAKLFSSVMQGKSISMSSKEMDVACEALKKATDNRQDWTWEQKKLYKAMVDYAKDNSSKR